MLHKLHSCKIYISDYYSEFATMVNKNLVIVNNTSLDAASFLCYDYLEDAEHKIHLFLVNIGKAEL